MNQAPAADALAVATAEDTPVALTLSGSDPDGDFLTFAIVIPPSHGTLSETAPDPTYTPAADYNGSDSFTFKVSDGAADSDPATVTITVTPVNDAPMLEPIGDKSVNEGQLLTFSLLADDVDRDSLTYSAGNLPAGADFDPPTRTFSWTPTFAQAGAYPNLRFQVSDSSLTAGEEITITVNNVNQAPAADALAVATAEDTPVALTLSGSDPDGDFLIFAIVTPPSHGTMSGTAPDLTYTPAADYNGSDSFTFKVSDGAADSDPATVTITVTPVNDPPTLDPIGNRSVIEGQLLTFTISATDPDGDTLTYSVFNLPSGAGFDPATRTFSWTPASGQAGAHPGVRFEVSDGALNDSEEITIYVISSIEAAYSHLVRTMDRYQTRDTPRLLESYTATPTFESQRNVAHLYDSALALWAFLARGTSEDLARARAIAEALVFLQQHDPLFNDGRLRDAYAADTLLDGAGKARLQLASSHTGNLAWAILALTRYHQAQGGAELLEAAVRLGEWVAAHTLDTRGAGGFTGGVDADLQPIFWKSSEHNLDLHTAFMRLYEATGEKRWLGWAAHARAFVEAMWNESEGRFRTGTREDGITINREPVPLDAQVWAVLALGEGHAGGLTWAEEMLRQEPCECGFLNGHRFSTGGEGCWFEGTAHLALARHILGDEAEADALLGELQEVQAQAPNGDGGGIVAACSDGVETGYGWGYFNALHVGATAWYLLAQQGVNPLVVPAVEIGPSVSGTVRGFDREPVAGVRVEARDADGALVGVALTDAQGRYRMALPAGRPTLTPGKEAHHFSPASRTVKVEAKDRQVKKFTVQHLTLTVVVRDRRGRRLPGVTLLLRQDETILDTGLTDARGRTRFSVYNPGTYTVEPFLEGIRFAPERPQATLNRQKKRGKVKIQETP